VLRFVAYAMFGWSAEIVWTACYALVAALRERRPLDRRLEGRTYLWMFPIYGAGGFAFEAAHAAMAAWPLLARGAVYMVGCFAIEYASGFLIKRATGRIPWDYSYARFHLHGLIRFDYVPVWFTFGLLLEQVERILRPL
jgi:uncharacterized membrane protein